jgi:D-threo-aldose 1-dehydrogenase
VNLPRRTIVAARHKRMTAASVITCMQSTVLAADVTTTRIGFGCAGLMREPSARKRRRLLDEAFDVGIRHFDVARMYGLGAAEGELGQFARKHRENVVIVTKFGIEAAPAPRRLARLQGPARRLLARYPALRGYVKRRSSAFAETHRYDAATARASLRTSLRELGTDYVDLLLLHGPAPSDRIELAEICGCLEEERRAGHLRAWGVAGEQDPCVHMKRSLPAGTVLQVRDDIFSRTSTLLSPELEPLITFGIVSGPLDRIAARLAGSSQRLAAWSDDLGVDCSSPEVIATLLLRDALQVNAKGVVLFSTVRPERLRRAASLVDGQDDHVLAAFRRRVSEDLAQVGR